MPGGGQRLKPEFVRVRDAKPCSYNNLWEVTYCASHITILPLSDLLSLRIRQMSWQEAARKAQDAVNNAILPQWKLPPGCTERLKDVRSIPRICGLLSKEQIRVTELSAKELVKNLASGELSSSEVTEAFCARAAIAHQLVSINFDPQRRICEAKRSQVNCLANFFPHEGLARAAELDEYLHKHGKPIGPLHGLPVALKVSVSARSTTNAGDLDVLSKFDHVIGYVRPPRKTHYVRLCRQC